MPTISLRHGRGLADDHDARRNIQEEQQEEQLKLPRASASPTVKSTVLADFATAVARLPARRTPTLRRIGVELRGGDDDHQVNDRRTSTTSNGNAVGMICHAANGLITAAPNP